jgi:hypothetical protein
MQNSTKHPFTQLSIKPAEIIEIRLWEMYVNSLSLYKRLSTDSLDGGPFEKNESGRITFRFTSGNWEEIKHLLYANRVPMVIKSNPLSALSVKGRQTAMA